MPIVEHRASDVFQDQQLHFQVVVLDRQLFIWIGVEPPRLSNLCMAMPTRLVSRPRCVVSSQPACPAGLGSAPLDRSAAGSHPFSHFAAPWARR